MIAQPQQQEADTTTAPAAVTVEAVKISRRRVLSWALASRLSLMALMILSDALLPDYPPGAGVVTITLASNCYCLKEHICDDTAHVTVMHHNDDDAASSCAIPLDSNQSQHLYSILLSPFTKWDAARFLSLAVNPSQRQPSPTGSSTTDISEQAHAFFPLVPHLYGKTALLLSKFIPTTNVTFIATTTMAALIINLIFFLLATLALHDLTLIKTNDIHLAETTCWIFSINPASVFFTTAYTEAVFCALIFIGYCMAARMKHRTVFAVTAVLPWWMMASYTRSNGSLTAVWLIIQSVASSVVAVQQKQSIWKVLGLPILYFGCAMLVLWPILHHDQQGKAMHCPNTCINPTTATSNTIDNNSEWCDATTSFYAHVQHKHWNVGLFHYYEWKQFPNFLLATPILCNGIAAVVTWIQISFISLVHTTQPSLSFISILQWAWDALARSHSHTMTQQPLLLGPTMLADYAILAITVMLGLTVAHVQVSTRLICSSCPAIYWYLAHLCTTQQISTLPTKQRTFCQWISSKQVVIIYCITYIILGIIMHVNWLPWT